MGDSTSTNIRNLLEGRINLVRNLAQNIAREPANAETLMDESVVTSSFLTYYLGKVDGSFSIRPNTKMPDGYDPRSRPWYKDGMNASGAILTEPYIDLATNKMVISVISKVSSSIRRSGAGWPGGTHQLVELWRHGVCVPGQRAGQDTGPSGQSAGHEVAFGFVPYTHTETFRRADRGPVQRASPLADLRTNQRATFRQRVHRPLYR